MAAGLGHQGQQFGGPDPHLLFNLIEALLQGAGVDAGILFGLRMLCPLKGFVDSLHIAEHRAQILQIVLIDLQLEIELREIRPQGVLPFSELRQCLLAFRFRPGLLRLLPCLLHAQLVPLGGLNQFGERFEVSLPAVDLLVDDDPVEAFFAVEQLLPERADVPAHNADMKQRLLRMQLGILDPLGDLDLLLARQQRHLAHLLEIHADGIIENVVLRRARLLFLRLLLALFVAVNLVRVENVDLEVLEDGNDVLDVLGIINALRQGVIDVIKR